MSVGRAPSASASHSPVESVIARVIAGSHSLAAAGYAHNDGSIVHALYALEARHVRFRELCEMKLPLYSALWIERRDLGEDLSHAYADLGTVAAGGASHLTHSNERPPAEAEVAAKLAQECLHRSLFCAPAGSEVLISSLCELALLAFSQCKPTLAKHFLHRASVELRHKAFEGSALMKARVSLNLCAALQKTQSFDEALHEAQAASSLLQSELVRDETAFGRFQERGISASEMLCVARYNCAVSHECMGHLSHARKEIREGLHVGRALKLDETHPLMTRLRELEVSLRVKEMSTTKELLERLTTQSGSRRAPAEGEARALENTRGFASIEEEQAAIAKLRRETLSRKQTREPEVAAGEHDDPSWFKKRTKVVNSDFINRMAKSKNAQQRELEAEHAREEAKHARSRKDYERMQEEMRLQRWIASDRGVGRRTEELERASSVARERAGSMARESRHGSPEEPAADKPVGGKGKGRRGSVLLDELPSFKLDHLGVFDLQKLAFIIAVQRRVRAFLRRKRKSRAIWRTGASVQRIQGAMRSWLVGGELAKARRQWPEVPTMARHFKGMGGHTLRIFLSSTFVDMQEERDLLMRRYVPMLRNKLNLLGVSLTVIDMRWGVTNEQASQTVEICLKEVDRSDYFVTFLGQRYGWMPTPDQLRRESFEAFPQLRSYIPGRSVTECEILCGALGWDAEHVPRPRRAFFYTRKTPGLLPARDGSYYGKLAEDVRASYERGEDAEKAVMMEKLKERLAIRKKRFDEYGRGASRNLPPVDHMLEYNEPEDFAKIFYDQMSLAIEKDFSKKKSTSAELPMRDIQFGRHISYAKQMSAATVPQRFVEAIHNYCAVLPEEGDPLREPLLIIGERGGGKTAAIAKWLCDENPYGFSAKALPTPCFLLPIFVGITKADKTVADITRTIIIELRRAFEFQADMQVLLAAEQEALAELLPKYLSICSRQARVVIIVDGIDRLEQDAKDRKELDWLPTRLPRNCSMIISTSSGTASAIALKAQRRDADTLVNIKPLDREEGREMIKGILKNANKTLREDVLNTILDAKRSSNALFLRMTLDEMMTVAVYETLKAVALRCLACETVEDLCELVLQRYEQDFTRELVSRTFAYIATSRSGITEEEIMALLDISQDQWTSFYWAALSSFRVNEGEGLLCISNRAFEGAVHKRYLSTKEVQVEYHMQLAKFYQRPELPAPRRCAEAPFHLVHSEQKKQLTLFLLDLSNVEHLLTNREDFRLFWRFADGGSINMVPTDLGSRYMDGMQKHEKFLRKRVQDSGPKFGEASTAESKEKKVKLEMANLQADLATFFAELYLYEDALMYEEMAQVVLGRSMNSMGLERAQALSKRGVFHTKLGQYQQAQEMLHLALGIFDMLIRKASREEAKHLTAMQNKEKLAYAEIMRLLESHSKASILCRGVLRSYKALESDPRSDLDTCAANNALGRICLDMAERATDPAERDKNLREGKTYMEAALAIINGDTAGDKGKGKKRKKSSHDLTLQKAEAARILGKIYLVNNKLYEAYETLKQAKRALAKIYGDMPALETAVMLEDLAVSIIRLKVKADTDAEAAGVATEYMRFTLRRRKGKGKGILAGKGLDEEKLEMDLVDKEVAREQALRALGHSGSRLEEHIVQREGGQSDDSDSDTDDDDDDAVEVAMRHLKRAMTIRKKLQSSNNSPHQDIASCMVIMAECSWFKGNAKEAFDLYKSALNIYTATIGERSKQVACLHSLVCLCHMQANQIAEAIEENRIAKTLVESMFGDQSWEFYRVSQDEVWVTRQSVSLMEKVSTQAKKSFELAERLEVRERILKAYLEEEGILNGLQVSWVTPRIRFKVLFGEQKKPGSAAKSTLRLASLEGPPESGPTPPPPMVRSISQMRCVPSPKDRRSSRGSYADLGESF